MTTPLTVNGVTYNYPQPNDENWGSDATNWASAVTSGMLQKAGGTFTLTADADFGANFGLRSVYYKSRAGTVAAGGVVRLAQNELISWRNATNTNDVFVGYVSSPIDAVSVPNLIAIGQVSGSPLTVGASSSLIVPATATIEFDGEYEWGDCVSYNYGSGTSTRTGASGTQFLITNGFSATAQGYILPADCFLRRFSVRFRCSAFTSSGDLTINLKVGAAGAAGTTVATVGPITVSGAGVQAVDGGGFTGIDLSIGEEVQIQTTQTGTFTTTDYFVMVSVQTKTF